MYENLPSELKAKHQWVVVRKTDKIPFDASSGNPASSTNPLTWSDYKTALKRVESGDFDYLGYVFSGDYVGIDIDDGFRDGMITDMCVDIMQTAMSYTEISRSGRGVHIIVKGTLPFKGANNRAGVEIYTSGRYFICTGDSIAYDDISENQVAIDYILKKYFNESAHIDRKHTSPRIYDVEWTPPLNGRVPLDPIYPEVLQGSRNVSLLSLGSQLATAGYPIDQIYIKLLKVNHSSFKPHLPLKEIQQIINSISRYYDV